MSRLILCFALSICGTGGLFADTIFSTFDPGQSFLTGAIWMIGGQPPEEIAASFVPAESFSLETIDFAAVSLSGTVTGVDVSLASGSSAPGPPIESFVVSAISGTASVLKVESIAHPQLDAGVTYWLVLSPLDPASPLIGWNQNDQGIVGVSARFDDGAWLALGTEVLMPAFDIVGTPLVPTVPEPSTWSFMILVIGLQVAVSAYRRRKMARA